MHVIKTKCTFSKVRSPTDVCHRSSQIACCSLRCVVFRAIDLITGEQLLERDRSGAHCGSWLLEIASLLHHTPRAIQFSPGTQNLRSWMYGVLIMSSPSSFPSLYEPSSVTRCRGPLLLFGGRAVRAAPARRMMGVPACTRATSITCTLNHTDGRGSATQTASRRCL